jgi:hypothetical protein
MAKRSASTIIDLEFWPEFFILNIQVTARRVHPRDFVSPHVWGASSQKLDLAFEKPIDRKSKRRPEP